MRGEPVGEDKGAYGVWGVECCLEDAGRDKTIFHSNGATLRRTNCLRRLRNSGEPSFLSLRKQWISPPLKAPLNCFHWNIVLSLPAVLWRAKGLVVPEGVWKNKFQLHRWNKYEKYLHCYIIRNRSDRSVQKSHREAISNGFAKVTVVFQWE